MKIVGKNKKLKAQQLIEFLLIAPFIVIFLGILTEYAYALNINMTLSEGLKTVSSSIYSQITPTTQTQSDIVDTVKTNFKQYLRDNNVPVSPENSIKVGCVINGETALFVANYTYIPAFTLPNVYLKFLPEKFNFVATAAVPIAFLGNNNYGAGTSSTTLDTIWSASDFSSLVAYNGVKKGIMKNNIAARNNILFLIPTTAPPLTNAYVLATWNGTLKKSGTDTYTMDTSDGKLYTCSATGCNYIKKFFDYLVDPANAYYNIIFVHDNTLPADLNTLSTSTSWISPLGTSDLSDLSADGALKRTLALVNGSTLSRGNYDNLDVFATGYNPAITMGGAYYKIQTFGSMIFVYYPALDTVDNITAGATIPNKNNVYDFGTKVN